MAAATVTTVGQGPQTALPLALPKGQALLPILGLGTWKSARNGVGAAVKAAIAAGYRHIDCAMIYGNEGEIGQALQEVFAEGKVKREDLFICSKLWNTCHHPENVRKACEQTLKDLQLTYLDLYIIHWPVAFAYTGLPLTAGVPRDEQGRIRFEAVPLQQTWQAMEGLVDAGLVKAIGLSNYSLIQTAGTHLSWHKGFLKRRRRGVHTPCQILDLLTYARIRPAVNQIEVHPYWNRQELIDECHRLGIHIVAYSCLGSGRGEILRDEYINQVAQRHNVTPAQVAIRWSIQRQVGVIPKSEKPERIEQNYNVWHFTLSEEEMNGINALNRNLCVCDTREYWNYALCV